MFAAPKTKSLQDLVKTVFGDGVAVNSRFHISLDGGVCVDGQPRHFYDYLHAHFDYPSNQNITPDVLKGIAREARNRSELLTAGDWAQYIDAMSPGDFDRLVEVGKQKLFAAGHEPGVGGPLHKAGLSSLRYK